MNLKIVNGFKKGEDAFSNWRSNFYCSLDESVLLDLKHLLLEAKQKIPPVLAVLQAENEGYLDLGGISVVKSSI